MFPQFASYAKQNGPGLAGAVLLHLLLALLAFSFLLKHGEAAWRQPATFVPVDLVRLGVETQTPRGEKALPQQSRPRTVKQEVASLRREAIAPKGTREPYDALEAQLKALARLHQPDMKSAIDDAGLSNVTAGSGNGERALYSVRDYIRAQVLRRWSLDLARLGGRRGFVRIRLAMKRNGVVTAAEIVEGGRADDAVWRDIAISAKNAVLLSSPIALPPGEYPAEMQLILELDPRDARH